MTVINLQTPRVQTAAETALIDLYAARMGALPGSPDVAAARDEAIDALRQQGLPTRRIEAWHYTDLRSLLRSIPAGTDAATQDLRPLEEGSTVLVLDDGVALGGKTPDGVALAKIAAKLEDGSFVKALGSRGLDDAIGAINAGLVSDGYHLSFAEGAATEKPIEIQIHANEGSHTRLAVNFAKGSKATIVERHTDGEAFVTAVSNVVVGDGAEVIWIIDQERGDGAVQLGQFNAHIGKDAKLTLVVMNSGCKLVRQEVHVAVKGEGSDFKLRGVNLVGGDSHVDVTMTLSHEVENTTSTEIVRNVVTGRGHGVFQGQIKVHQAAQKTDAKMACNTLLLSDDGKFSTKPELEIFADDVACGHGATVREVEPQHLFYLMARGIPEAQARGLLVKAFVAEIIEELEDEMLVEALETRLDDWLATHA
ncbi:MAG: Fe-S cluster assembly protein SufD [Rhizobiaceae bacterium]